MRALSLLWCVALSSVGMLAGADEAAACSCGFGLHLLAPEEGATDVPLDTRVWIGETEDRISSRAELVLFVADEPDAIAARPATISTDRGDLRVLTPVAPLRPSTAYEVWACEGTECQERILGFTTGVGLTDEMPEIPVLLDQEHDRSGGLGVICPRAKTIELRTMHAGLLVIQDEASVQLDVQSADDLDSALVITPDEVFEIDEGGCEGGWPGGRRAEVRFGALDLAGNFSGFGDVEVLDIGCGCRSEGGSRSGLHAFALLVVVVGIRRRRVHAPRPGRAA